MEDKIVEELHALEQNLRRIGFKESVITPVMQAIEAESFLIMQGALPEEHLENYFRLLHHKVGIIESDFINRRKSDSGESASRIWRSRASFQKGRIESLMPDSELSRALHFLIDKSFEL